MELQPIITSNFLSVEHNVPISEVAGKLQQDEKRCALVFRNNKYLGLVDKRKLLHAQHEMSTYHIGKVAVHSPILDIALSLPEALKLFVESNLLFLPVEYNRKIVGVISALDLALHSQQQFQNFTVGDAKLFYPPTITEDDSLGTALRVMYEQGLDLLPVVSRGTVTGVISYKSLVRKLLGWSPKRDASEAFNRALRSKAGSDNTKSLMDINVDAVVEDHTSAVVQESLHLADVVQNMNQLRQTTALVFAGKEYRGILTLQNLLRVPLNKVPQQLFTVAYKGLHKLKLTEHQQKALSVVVEREGNKLQRKINTPFGVVLHAKAMNKQGREQEFEVILRLEMTGTVLTSERTDWDLERAVHKCFNAVSAEFKKQFPAR